MMAEAEMSPNVELLRASKLNERSEGGHLAEIRKTIGRQEQPVPMSACVISKIKIILSV
jgi:hypothetical protein